MKYLFCGDRYWTNRKLIRKVLASLLKDGDIILHGGARGADTICGEVSKELGFTPRIYRAEWEKYGRAAGPIRNQKMLDEGLPDKVYAFHNDIENSRGTKDMIERANKKGILVNLITEDG